VKRACARSFSDIKAARCLGMALLLTAPQFGPEWSGRCRRQGPSIIMNSAILTLLAPAAAAAGGEPPAWLQFMPLVAMAGIFWFLLLRPQMRQQKEKAAKISAIKKGDQVLTGGGLLGKVLRVDDDYAELELGPNVKVKALKSTIADIVPPTSGKPAND
jgi:preprotein translocase subunit YajC